MRIKFREGVWRGGPQPLITELSLAELSETPKSQPGPPKRSRDPRCLAKAQGRERLSWLTAIPFHLRRPESITLTNRSASEVFRKLLPGTPR